MFRLTHTAFKATRFHNLYIRLNADHALHTGGDLLFQRDHLVHFIRIIIRSYFHLDLESIGVVHTVHHDQVMRFEFRHFQQYGFNLRREYVDTTDDHHIVATAEDTAHTDSGTAAFALFIDQVRQVTRTVTDHRHTFLGQGGKYQLALFTFRHRLQSDRIDDFREEMVFPQVGTVLAFAFATDTGTADFC